MSTDSSAAHTVTIDLGERSYPIVIGTDLLGNPATYAALPKAAAALIVTNTTVAPLYAEQLRAALAALPQWPSPVGRNCWENR